MRISDWSSDVCSSDLGAADAEGVAGWVEEHDPALAGLELGLRAAELAHPVDQGFGIGGAQVEVELLAVARPARRPVSGDLAEVEGGAVAFDPGHPALLVGALQIGRASSRERGCSLV